MYIFNNSYSYNFDIADFVTIHVCWKEFFWNSTCFIYIYVPRKKSVVNVVGKRNNAFSEGVLRYRYWRDVTSEAMMKRPWPTRCTTQTSRRTNSYVKFIHAVFTIARHLSIIDISFSLFSSFLPVISTLYSDLRQLSRFPLSPIHIHHTFPHNPRKCIKQIKRCRLRSAYQCCFYRIGARQTSAPFFRPFFSNHCVLSVEQAPPVSMSPAT